VTDYFVDTCVFLAYSCYFDKYHPDCVRFFAGSYGRFTGKRVESELKNALARRRRLYIALAGFLGRGGCARDFVVRRMQSMNENDKRHFQQILLIVENKSPYDALTTARALNGLIQRGVEDALKKIHMPLIEMAMDLACEQKISGLIKNPWDTKIFIDALRWGENRSSAIFLTLDWTDFISSRMKLLRVICEHLKISKTDELPLRIRHVREISRQT